MFSLSLTRNALAHTDALGWLRNVALEMHAEISEAVSRVDERTPSDCSIRYMHPKSTGSQLAAMACVAADSVATSGGGLEQSDAERMSFDLGQQPRAAIQHSCCVHGSLLRAWVLSNVIRMDTHAPAHH